MIYIIMIAGVFSLTVVAILLKWSQVLTRISDNNK